MHMQLINHGRKFEGCIFSPDVAKQAAAAVTGWWLESEFLDFFAQALPQLLNGVEIVTACWPCNADGRCLLLKGICGSGIV